MPVRTWKRCLRNAWKKMIGRRKPLGHYRPEFLRARPSLEVLEGRIVPANLLVNSLLDNTTSGDGLVTLREAVLASNNLSSTDLGQAGTGNDTITFDSALTMAAA